MLLKSINADLKLTVFNDPVLGLIYIKDMPGSKLILLDINMPVMNAWEFLDELIASDICIDVVILSSSINPEDVTKAETYKNVKSFLNKPLSKANIMWLINDSGLTTELPSLEA